MSTLPFSIEQFFDVFRRYNEAIYPAQLVLLGLAVAASAALTRKDAAWFVSTVLAVLWLWSGIVYHWVFFSTINPAAYFFGALFVVQGIVFFYFGVIRRTLSFRPSLSGSGIVGGVFILYALAIYPLIGYALGRTYADSPTFGTPCPTAIFTFGMLMLAERKVPIYVYVIPFAWSLIGGSAAILLAVPEDLMLPVAGMITAVTLFRRR